MFYEQSQIDSILACKQCHIKCEIPKLLPCGDSICADCAFEIRATFTVNGCRATEFTCPICSNVHDVPKRGDDFPTSNALLKILKQQPSEIPRSRLIETFKTKLDEVRNIGQNLSNDLANDGVDKVQMFCQELRIEIELATERRLEEIQKLNEVLLRQVKEYEDERVGRLKTGGIEDVDTKAISELKEFDFKWRKLVTLFFFFLNLFDIKLRDQVKGVSKKGYYFEH